MYILYMNHKLATAIGKFDFDKFWISCMVKWLSWSRLITMKIYIIWIYDIIYIKYIIWTYVYEYISPFIYIYIWIYIAVLLSAFGFRHCDIGINYSFRHSKLAVTTDDRFSHRVLSNTLWIHNTSTNVLYADNCKMLFNILTENFKVTFKPCYLSNMSTHILINCREMFTEPKQTNPDSMFHGANMGPIWGRKDPGGSQNHKSCYLGSKTKKTSVPLKHYTIRTEYLIFPIFNRWVVCNIVQ